MAEVEDRLERDLKMIGATAIEDRLQDQLGSLESPSRNHRVHAAGRHQGLGAHRRQGGHGEEHRLLLQAAHAPRHGAARVPEGMRRLGRVHQEDAPKGTRS